MTDLERLESKLDLILDSINRPGVVLLNSKDLAKKLNRSYPIARKIVNSRILKPPIQFVLTNQELINEKLLDEWLEVPENLEKLRKL